MDIAKPLYYICLNWQWAGQDTSLCEVIGSGVKPKQSVFSHKLKEEWLSGGQVGR